MSDRPSPRVDIRLTGSISSDGATPTRVVSVNLSDTGILLKARQSIPRGVTVQLEFPEFKAGGDVIWNRDTEDGILVGVKFLSLGWRDRRKVRELVALSED